MLILKPGCECCNKDLPPELTEAMICSYEYIFCRDCAPSRLHGRCPNCGSELLGGPIRPPEKLSQYPASTERVYKPGGMLRLCF